MLGKLIKHEFSQTYKPVLLLCLVTIVLTAINCAAILLGIEDVTMTNEMTVSLVGFVHKILVVLNVVSLIATCAGCFIYCCYHFFKTMYSEQGYLTHTLPVNPVATFFVKYFVAVIWMIVSVATFIICVGSIGFTDSGINPITGFFELIKNYHAGIETINAETLSVIGMKASTLINYAYLAGFLGILYGLSFIFTAMTIGQLSSEHKTGASIGAGVILYLVKQILSVVLMVQAVSIIETTDFAALSEKAAARFLPNLYWSGMGIIAIIVALELIVDSFIVNRHINLQ